MNKDIQIWTEIKNSNPDGLEELYVLFHKELFSYGMKMTGEQFRVEDAIQETFISIWKYRNSMSVPASVRQYLLKAFRNQLFTNGNRQISTDPEEKPLDFSFEIGFDEKIIEGEEAEDLKVQVNNALSRLTGRQREIIYFRFFKDLSYEETAEIMNMQTRAAYKLAARALSSLKEILGARILQMLLF